MSGQPLASHYFGNNGYRRHEVLTHHFRSPLGLTSENDLDQRGMLLTFALQCFFREDRFPQPEVAIAFDLVEQAFTHLKQVG